jgi:deoxyribodipyrimidine photo-lyase
MQHLSNLSPYFHFGQLSVQRAALEIGKHRKSAPAAVDTFLEEAVVRRELSDNFCHYEPNYDNIECAAAWARETLKIHEKDKREHVYTR